MIPLLIVTLAALGWAWFRQLRHRGGGKWRIRSLIVLIASTIFAVGMWTWRLYPIL